MKTVFSKQRFLDLFVITQLALVGVTILNFKWSRSAESGIEDFEQWNEQWLHKMDEIELRFQQGLIEVNSDIFSVDLRVEQLEESPNVAPVEVNGTFYELRTHGGEIPCQVLIFLYSKKVALFRSTTEITI